jgi:hypothetical protein
MVSDETRRRLIGVAAAARAYGYCGSGAKVSWAGMTGSTEMVDCCIIDSPPHRLCRICLLAQQTVKAMRYQGCHSGPRHARIQIRWRAGRRVILDAFEAAASPCQVKVLIVYARDVQVCWPQQSHPATTKAMHECIASPRKIP